MIDVMMSSDCKLSTLDWLTFLAFPAYRHENETEI